MSAVPATSRDPGDSSAAAGGVLARLIAGVLRLARVVGMTVTSAAGVTWKLITPFGRALAIFTLVAFLAGYLLGWAEAVLFAWSGLLLFAVAALYLVGRSAYDIRLSLRTRRVVVGEKAPGQLFAGNLARHRVGGARLEIPVGADVVTVTIPSIGARAEFRHSFPVPAVRRGVFAVGPARTVRADPLGLVRREASWGSAEVLYVHPRTIGIPSLSTGLVRDLEGRPTRDLTSSDISFHAIRDYHPGDERRTIHWKSTAKTGNYMVRQFEQTRRSHLMVALSLSEGEYGTDEEFELAVSVAGSLAASAIRSGREVSVVSATAGSRSAAELNVRSPATVLDGLAAVERSAHGTGVVELGRLAAAGAAGASIVFLLCGTPVGIGVLRRAQTMFPAGVEVAAFLCDPEAVPTLNTLPGLTVGRIGYLEDLQKTMAKSRAS